MKQTRNNKPVCSLCDRPHVSITPATAKRSLICGYCFKSKLSGNAFCNNCFYALPRDLRKFLFRPIRNGFEGAHTTALEWLTEKYGEK